MFNKKLKQDNEKLRQIVVFLSKRMDRMELAVDRLGKIVGLEWKDEPQAWKPEDGRAGSSRERKDHG